MSETTVEVLRAYRFCLDPTEGQRRTLARYAGAARWGFNQRLGALVDGHRRYLQEVAFTTYTDEVDEAGARALVKQRGGIPTPTLTAQSKQLTALIADHRARAAADPAADDAL